MRSEVTSLSNWANDRSTLSVSRPIEVVVLNCWVTETNDTPMRVEQFDQLGKIGQRSGQAIDLVYHDDIKLPRADIIQQSLQVGTIGGSTGISPSSYRDRIRVQTAWA
jgi:hypothetical protein